MRPGGKLVRALGYQVMVLYHFAQVRVWVLARFLIGAVNVKYRR